jgi:hypothetical protein
MTDHNKLLGQEVFSSLTQEKECERLTSHSAHIYWLLTLNKEPIVLEKLAHRCFREPAEVRPIKYTPILVVPPTSQNQGKND